MLYPRKKKLLPNVTGVQLPVHPLPLFRVLLLLEPHFLFTLSAADAINTNDSTIIKTLKNITQRFTDSKTKGP